MGEIISQSALAVQIFFVFIFSRIRPFSLDRSFNSCSGIPLDTNANFAFVGFHIPWILPERKWILQGFFEKYFA